MTKQPRKSQAAKVVQAIGPVQVAVKYHRPAVKDREIFGSLVPYGKIWRAGANENTIFWTSAPTRINGQDLPAGKYGLHIIPEKDKATLILSKEADTWGSFAYNSENDALRAEMKVKNGKGKVEHLAYYFTDLTPDGATCVLAWNDTRMSFRVEADVHDLVVADLKKQLQTQAGWSWQGWHEAASYCLNNETHLDQGMKWAGRSVFMNPNPNNMAVKAKLYAATHPDKPKATAMTASLEKDMSAHSLSWKEYNAAAQLILANEGSNEKAMEWMKKSIEMNANMTNMMSKADLLEKMGHADKAAKVRKKAIEKGSDPELNTYGYKLLFSGKGKEALAVFEANAEKHPDNPNVWDSLAECHKIMGNRDKAIKYIKKCLSMDPDAAVRANSEKMLAELQADNSKA